MLDQTAQTSQSIEVACNGAWTATTDSSWITVSPSSGSGLSSIRITVRKNRSIDPRTGHVTVKTGSTVLGVLRVTQAGSKLMLDTNAVTAYYNETNAVINVSSAEDWTVETPNWIVATPSSGSGNTAVTVRILENEGNGIRGDRIRFSTASDSEEVAVTQLDRVSSCFNNIDSYGNVTAVTASDYNHRLATWAMELSYAAYNYPNGEELPIIPGAFMGDFTQTAGMLLEDNGFVNISEYNYTSDSRAAHTIGCRFVEFPGTRNLQSNNIGGNYNVHQHNGTNIQLPVRNLLDSVCIRDYDQGRADFRDNTLITGEDTEISTSHDDEIETKPLVVVDIRGSVTVSDWINDVMTQLDSENNRFAAFADEIFTNVENFYSVSENGSFGRNSSSDYNHKLATWAMELSYAAYNYPNGEELPIIPGAFMGDFVKSANTLLSENGFVNITDLNYGSNESGAHTIGWRPIGGVDTGLLQISDDIGGNDNVGWDNTSDEELYVWNFLDRLRTLDGNSGRADSGNVEVLAGKDNVVDVIQSSAIRTMPLVVVDVRGSVTLSDWINDVMTQFDSENNRFAAFADEIFTNVENFYSVSENGSFGRNSSSDYNHKLATWAMELSYAAYNYPNGEELPIIPGAFMGDFTKTAGMLLEDNGFVNISEYNYTSDSRAAHTIGWRPVEVAVSETSQIINDSGGIGNVYQYNIDDKGSVLYNLLDSVCVCDYDQGRNYFRDDTVVIEENTALNTSQDDEVETKPLVVVDVRGSVTISDWINDVMTQFDSENNRFAAFADEIFTNVENFYSVSENGSFGRNSSSDYNHKLATWAMELSYAAYNYPNGEELPIIPGAFMGDFTQTAGMLLEDNGFVNISEYNYTSDSRAAHTIGWRPVEVAVSETSQIINDSGGIGNVYQYNIDDKGSVLYNLLDSVCVYERNTCRSNSGNPEIMDRNVDVLEVSENSLATTTIKNLVVIDIRGSVTLLDWGNDIVTQFAPNNNRFAALADEVLTNVENYLSSTGLQDPIILVTGHSMGAAIANILAARLNGIMDPGNIYAYTFTFTRW